MSPIEQLIQRYFEADTTLDEERLLRRYFATNQVPPHLEPYRELFATLNDMATIHQAQQVSSEHKQQVFYRAKRITWQQRLAPLYKAVACVAVLVSITMAVNQNMQRPTTIDILAPANQQHTGNPTASGSITNPGDTLRIIDLQTQE